jgi:uncharacterized membrane protein YhiD involved in acid resistance
MMRRAAIAAAVIGLLWVWPAVASQRQPELPEPPPPADAEPAVGLRTVAVRLPLAAVLGAALALRPKRRGTPPRTPPVVQTQIVLAIVGAVIMMVIGPSLARAFGIVGAANLIRYRSKIDDPKDAVVMLCTLAVGLACGVGLLALGTFSTAFMVVALWIIESFEPRLRTRFILRIKTREQADEQRGAFERILERHGVDYELRTSSNEEVCYDVHVPPDRGTDRISNELLALDPKGDTAVEWDEKKKPK